MTPERFQRLKRALDRRQPDLTVLMERVNKSHNFAAILRNCEAAGVFETHVVPPERGMPSHIGTSAGTTGWVPVHAHSDTDSAISSLKGAGFQVVAAHPTTEALDYREADYTRPTAIMMGAELFGVSERALALADVTVVIPMEGLVQSLNVSVATALLLFEARRQREELGMYDRIRMNPEVHARRLFEWCYPREARDRRSRGLPYPPLDPETGAWMEGD